MRKLNKKIELRISDFDKNKIKFLAEKYHDGNVSRFMVYCALNFPRHKMKNKKAS